MRIVLEPDLASSLEDRLALGSSILCRSLLNDRLYFSMSSILKACDHEKEVFMLTCLSASIVQLNSQSHVRCSLSVVQKSFCHLTIHVDGHYAVISLSRVKTLPRRVEQPKLICTEVPSQASGFLGTICA